MNDAEFFRQYGIDFHTEVAKVAAHNQQCEKCMITFDKSNQLLARKISELFAAMAAGTYLEKFTGTEWLPYVGQWDEIPKNPMAFRVRPEPKYRAWTLNEIPVGAIARRKKRIGSEPRIAQVIIGADLVAWRTHDECYAVMHFERDTDHRATCSDNLLHSWEWKWAHEEETAWRTCGVAEGAT
jgi:hypothetical protein